SKNLVTHAVWKLLLNIAANYPRDNCWASSPLTSMHRLEHFLESGSQFTKVLVGRNEDQVEQVAVGPLERNQPITFGDSASALPFEGRGADHVHRLAGPAIHADIFIVTDLA